MRYMYWAYDQTPLLHKWRWSRRKTESLANAYRRHRRQPVCVLAKTDEVWNFFCYWLPMCNPLNFKFRFTICSV